MIACSCGETRAHVIARRRTADFLDVELWSDGPVTSRFGHALPGVPIARPRSASSLALALCAGWLFVGEVEIHDTDDLGDLYAACKWAAARDGLPGTVRARLAEMRTPRLTPVWTVLRTDRDGRPTERVWRLPRMRWPGTVVWDHVSVGARGRRYEIFYEVSGSDGTYTSSGLRFRTLDEVSAHLREVQS